MTAYSDIGPQGPTRMEVCLLATEVMRMAGQARELCGTGPGLDLARAIRTLRKARDLLGEMTGEHGDGGRDADD